MFPAMRRLMLLRHAKSDRSEPGMADQSRPLNPRGVEAAARAGAYIAHHALVPDYVLCSPARRTRETWAALAEELPAPPAVKYDARLYDATAAAILAVLREAPAKIQSLMVVGHNPGLHELAALLIASGDVEERERLREKLPTAGLVVIEFAIDGWAALHRHAGRLDRFIVPSTLDPAID
jgi:phosphohistidine phosphatase